MLKKQIYSKIHGKHSVFEFCQHDIPYPMILTLNQFINESEHSNNSKMVLDNDKVRMFWIPDDVSYAAQMNEMMSLVMEHFATITPKKFISSELKNGRLFFTGYLKDHEIGKEDNKQYKICGENAPIVNVLIYDKPNDEIAHKTLKVDGFNIRISYMKTNQSYGGVPLNSFEKVLDDLNLKGVLKIPDEIQNVNWVKKNIPAEYLGDIPWLSDNDNNKLKSRILKNKFDL